MHGKSAPLASNGLLLMVDLPKGVGFLRIMWELTDAKRVAAAATKTVLESIFGNVDGG